MVAHWVWNENGAVLDVPVEGVNLRPGTLRDQLAGDPWSMLGLFLVQNDVILWHYRFRHAGDHPDFARIPDLHLSG